MLGCCCLPPLAAVAVGCGRMLAASWRCFGILGDVKIRNEPSREAREGCSRRRKTNMRDRGSRRPKCGVQD